MSYINVMQYKEYIETTGTNKTYIILSIAGHISRFSIDPSLGSELDTCETPFEDSVLLTNR